MDFGAKEVLLKESVAGSGPKSMDSGGRADFFIRLLNPPRIRTLFGSGSRSRSQIGQTSKTGSYLGGGFLFGRGISRRNLMNSKLFCKRGSYLDFEVEVGLNILRRRKGVGNQWKQSFFAPARVGAGFTKPQKRVLIWGGFLFRRCISSRNLLISKLF